jgi:hypothetical protein
MKKTDNGKRTKLTLNRETVRTLTEQELTLAMGGACRHGTTNSAVPPPDENGLVRLDRGHPTC